MNLRLWGQCRCFLSACSTSHYFHFDWHLSPLLLSHKNAIEVTLMNVFGTRHTTISPATRSCIWRCLSASNCLLSTVHSSISITLASYWAHSSCGLSVLLFHLALPGPFSPPSLRNKSFCEPSSSLFLSFSWLSVVHVCRDLLSTPSVVNVIFKRK